MAIPGNANLLLLTEAAGAAPTGYTIDRSIRLNSPDSAYLNRTPASAGNRKTWTLSFWIKRAKLSTDQSIFATAPGGGSLNGNTNIKLETDNALRVIPFDSGGSGSELKTNAVFRDPSAWYHVVIAYDTTQSTSSDRAKIYINGVLQSLSVASYPSQNADLGVNNTIPHVFGRYEYSAANYLDSYLADCHLIDGQQLDPTSFGEFDDNGVWQPKQYVSTSKNDGTVWSSSTTSNVGFYSGEEAIYAFDADETTYAGVATGGATNYIEWTGSVSISSSLRVKVSTGTNSVHINGSGTAAVSGTGWLTVPSPPSTLTGLRVYGSSGVGARIYAVEIDGAMLVDGAYSYGRNGFHLDFADNSSAAALGDDTSGNGNDWTPNNFAVGGAVYSNSTTNTTNPKNAFDGSLSTSASNTGDPSNPMVFSSLGQTGVTTFEYYTTDGGTYDVAVNGGSFATDSGGSGWRSVSSPPSTFSSISIKNTAGAPNTAIVRAFRVNGTILVDSNDNDNDSLRDSPTNGDTANDTGAGGEVPGNYATLNPLAISPTYLTLANGNLQTLSTGGGATYQEVPLTIPVDFDGSSKWYVEFSPTAIVGTYYPSIGISPASKYFNKQDQQCGSADGGTAYMANGQKYNAATLSSYAASFTGGDVIGVAVDEAAGTVTMYKNGSSQGTLASSLTGKQVITVTHAGASICHLNAGQRAFAYSAPSGYKALCTANLDDPTIADGSTAMDVALYTGNGSTQSISGLNFSPDFVWIKDRAPSGNNHGVFDVVRGTTKGLFTSLTAAEVTDSDSLTSFDSTGFSTGSGGTTFSTNINGYSYVAWTWDAGSSTVSNTDGSVTSNVRANPTAGFSIATFTNPASGGWTFGHGLNAAPEFVVMRPTNATSNWQTYHKGLTAISSGRKFIWLNSTNAEMGTANNYWTSDPSSTIVSAGSGMNPGSAQAHIAYCFAPVEGYSAFGSYTGNGSADGPFVYTGHRSRWIMIKDATQGGTGQDWIIIDTARDSYNVVQSKLYANLSAAESTNTNNAADILSNGFKLKSTNSATNASGDTYIWASFAENPFSIARAR